VLVRYVAQQAAALGVDGRPGRVLAAWGDDGCPGASGQRPGELIEDGTALIGAHGLGLQPECADQVRDARPARIFDGHPVARPQLCLQDAFDAIERAAGDGDVPVDAVGGEVGLGQLDQPAELDRPTVELVSRIKTGEGRGCLHPGRFRAHPRLWPIDARGKLPLPGNRVSQRGLADGAGLPYGAPAKLRVIAHPHGRSALGGGPVVDLIIDGDRSVGSGLPPGPAAGTACAGGMGNLVGEAG
jgi:hypothetical protein